MTLSSPQDLPPAPTSLRLAGWPDFGRLVLLALSGVVVSASRHKASVSAFVGAWAVVIAMSVWVGIAEFTVIVLAAIVPLAGAAVLVVTTARVLDRRRYILLADDRRSVLDALLRGRRIKPANHARLIGATSAPQLREAFAEWADALEGYEIRFTAANTRVAKAYIAQFPNLERTGQRVPFGVELRARGDDTPSRAA